MPARPVTGKGGAAAAGAAGLGAAASRAARQHRHHSHRPLPPNGQAPRLGACTSAGRLPVAGHPIASVTRLIMIGAGRSDSMIQYQAWVTGRVIAWLSALERDSAVTLVA